jgi:hypothetical protein
MTNGKWIPAPQRHPCQPGCPCWPPPPMRWVPANVR